MKNNYYYENFHVSLISFTPGPFHLPIKIAEQTLVLGSDYDFVTSQGIRNDDVFSGFVISFYQKIYNLRVFSKHFSRRNVLVLRSQT